MRDLTALGGIGRLLADIGMDTREPKGSDSWEPIDGRWTWLRNRPSIPPLFIVACGVWAGVALAIELLFDGRQDWWIYAAGVSIAIIALAASLFWRGHAFYACLALGLALGCIVGSAHCHALHTHAQELLEYSGQAEVEIVRDSRTGEFGSAALARTDGGALVRLSLPVGTSLLVGDRIAFQAHWQKPSEKIRRDCWRDGIVAIARVGSYETRPTRGIARVIGVLRRRSIDYVAHVQRQRFKKAQRFIVVLQQLGQAGVLGIAH